MGDYTGKTINYYNDGQFFGENFVQLNARRKSTISSLGHSELLVLSKMKMNIVSEQYPEFALLLFKWSHNEMWRSLKYWERMRYTIDTQKSMKQNGVKISFILTYQYLNDYRPSNATSPSSPRCSQSVPMSKARMSVLNTSLVSYSEFNGIYE